MSRDIPIETGVPIPQRSGCRTAASKAASQLKVRESILCLTEHELDAARRTIRRAGGTYCQRKVEGGWRLWRMT